MTEEVITPPADTAAQPAAQPVTPEFKIPDAYKDKAWASKIKTEDDVYKQIDNLNSLVGKKSVIPDFKTAKEDELNKYFEQFRPENKDAYKFDDATPAPLKEGYSAALYDAGVSEFQANKLIAKIDALNKAEMAKMQSPEEFDKMTEKEFGSNWQKSRDEALGFLRTALNEKEQAVLEVIPNEALMAMYKVAHFAKTKYGAEETGGQAGGSGAPIKVDLAGEADKLYSEIQTATQAKPPNFQKIEELKGKLREINNKRAAS